MKGFYIEITNHLLDPKHKKKMGSAIWEFLWFLDKMTSISEKGIGKVLGGKPINLRDLAKDLGGSENNVSKNIKKLAENGYISTRRTPYGIVISVNKAKKRFKQKVEKRITKIGESPKLENHSFVDENHQKVDSNIRQDNDSNTNVLPVKEEEGNFLTLVQYRRELQELVDYYNKNYGKAITAPKSGTVLNNFVHWRQAGYSVEDMKKALKNAQADSYWKNIMNVIILLRKNNFNKNHEPVDRIGEFLDREPRPEKDNRPNGEYQVEKNKWEIVKDGVVTHTLTGQEYSQWLKDTFGYTYVTEYDEEGNEVVKNPVGGYKRPTIDDVIESEEDPWDF